MKQLTASQQRQLDAIGQEHDSLGDKLRILERNKWLAELPEDYVPLVKDIPPPKKLHLTVTEKAQLEAEIIYTQIGLLKLAKQFHQIKYDDTPVWITQTLEKLQKLAQQVFAPGGAS